MLCLAKRMARNREHLHVYCKIFMVNQLSASWKSTCGPQDFHGQSIASDEISSVGAVIQVWNWKQLRKQLRVSCSKTHWLPLEDTSNALLYFLTTCTALCHRGTLKCLLMSVIIDKRVSRKPQHRRKLRLNHLLWLQTLQQLDAADTIALYIITFND